MEEARAYGRTAAARVCRQDLPGPAGRNDGGGRRSGYRYSPGPGASGRRSGDDADTRLRGSATIPAGLRHSQGPARCQRRRVDWDRLGASRGMRRRFPTSPSSAPWMRVRKQRPFSAQARLWPKSYQANLALVHVLETPPATPELDFTPYLKDLMDAADAHMRDLKGRLNLDVPQTVIDSGVTGGIHQESSAGKPICWSWAGGMIRGPSAGCGPDCTRSCAIRRALC